MVERAMMKSALWIAFVTVVSVAILVAFFVWGWWAMLGFALVAAVLFGRGGPVDRRRRPL